ncbi:MAG: hypothetical protein H0V44_03585 [Planctomycetes bacterium]|nr:hypothetical protein [Planctomycetota bacterium]
MIAHAWRSAFTLVEILVSIMIFGIVSIALITILLICTNLFRAGEYSRASTDEVIAALGTLDNDLKRLVPGRDGGFFFSQITDTVAGAAPGALSPRGNCAVAFKITNPDRGQIDSSGRKARLIVLYWVGGPTANDEYLYRDTEVAADSDGNPATVNELDVVNTIIARADSPVIARRCLHLGVWISTLDNRRLLAANNPVDQSDWTQGRAGATLPVEPTAPTIVDPIYCTEATGPLPTDAAKGFPDALRFTVTLANGRYAPKGYVIQDNGGDIKVAGLGALPVVPGSMVRIDNEWIAYDAYDSGTIKASATRTARRSTAATHLRNDPVWLGQTFSLVRIFPK